MESFEQIGIWFLPEEPEGIIPGKLSFAPDKEPRLDLIGTWEYGDNIEEKLNNLSSQNPSLKKYPIINGWVIGESNNKQERVTLCNCQKKLELKSGNEIKTTTIFPQIIILGYHFSQIEDIKITDMLVRYEQLEAWVNSPNIEVISIKDELVIKQKQQETQFIGSLGKFSITIKDQVPNLSTGPIGKINGIEERKSILFRTEPPAKLDEFIDVVHAFQDFLTFCCGQKILPEIIKSEVVCSETKKNFPIKILYQLSVSPISKASPSRFLLRFSEMKGDSENVLKNWQDLSENLVSIIQLYLRMYYLPVHHVNGIFLSLAQALEAFHRAKYDEKFVTKSLFNKIKKELKECFRDLLKKHEVNEDLHESILGEISHWNKFTFKERLDGLLSDINDSLPETFFNESNPKSDFSEKVKTTRNALTHLSNKNDTENSEIFQGQELRDTNVRLMIILEICLLQDLGLEPAKIKSAVTEKYLICSGENPNRDEFLRQIAEWKRNRFP